MTYASCACEVARRRLLPVSDVENLVDTYIYFVAREVWTDRQLLDSFQRAAVERVKASEKWDAYLAERQSVAELLASADSASNEVELREENPATPAAGAVEQSQIEQSIAPLLTPEPEPDADADPQNEERPEPSGEAQAGTATPAGALDPKRTENWRRVEAYIQEVRQLTTNKTFDRTAFWKFGTYKEATQFERWQAGSPRASHRATRIFEQILKRKPHLRERQGD